MLDSFHQGDIYYLRARDSSASDIQNVASDYWRSYLDIGDRIATLTVLAREDEPISPEEGLATLRQFTQAVVAANPEGGTAPPRCATGGRPRDGWNALECRAVSKNNGGVTFRGYPGVT